MAHKQSVGLMLNSAWGPNPPPLPLRVTITRLGPKRMDPDNNVSACKDVQDAVADWVGQDDGSDGFEWVYRQELCQTPGVRIRVEPLDRLFSTDASVKALDDIAALCGCDEWEYPGQVVRDVQFLRQEYDKIADLLRRLSNEICPLCGAEYGDCASECEADQLRRAAGRLRAL